ncbi:lipopolysaccharide export system ATP-binding protein [Spirochaeta isovalerica]|uniref:Lipopolysaccharide export system ATP-binding protein n=1 Tax=Spirochaeta isovalerica TaxID=150 RepID=A0A841RFY5_9SPIO|nr:lipopolysaccharide export system ATP-binding protein [Spirochaeta isovalerica]
MEAILKVEGLRKVFGRKEAVKDMSFSMKKGEIVGLLGPNGAGKTTCFYMIAGFIRPTSGKIFLNEKEITHDPMFRRALNGISYLPQDASVFRKLTVEQNIWAILETRKDLSTSDKKDYLESLISDLGIGNVRKQKAFTLSGGERRRTEIARSLASNPQFLLLDEPFAGIDPIAVFEIKKIVEHLSDRGIGVLITDHNVRDTLAITERSYITNLGEILVSGSKEELLQSETARKIYLGHDFSM